MTAQLLLALAAVLAAAALHHGIGRAGRRLPRWLAARRKLPVAPGARLQRGFALGSLALQAGLWLGVLLFASECVAALMRLRDSGAALLMATLRAPLFSLNERLYSALDVLALPLLLLGVWLGVGLLMRLLRSWVQAALGAGRGMQTGVAALLRYVLALLGFLVVLQAWGVDVRSLAIGLSVLGVGVGFGLQNIANNVVSGLLLELGRAVRPGDFVQVGEYSGTVTRVGSRTTEIVTPDQVTILVPNSRFLESEVVNWSHGDPLCRVHVPVGVAYGSDLGGVRRALLEAARGHSAVLADPRPQVQLRRFGESSLDCELLVWTRDPRSQQRLVSDLNFRIEQSLRRHGIGIPFPQRDLHLRSPSLERALEAWRRRDGEADAAPLPAAELATPAPDPPGAPGDRGPDEWSDAEVAAAAARLRGGVSIRDRRHRLSLHPRCFVGAEAVDWLVANEGLSRAEALALGRRLVASGLAHHVLDEQDFRDGFFFYRFRADEVAPVAGNGGSGMEASDRAAR